MIRSVMACLILLGGCKDKDTPSAALAPTTRTTATPMPPAAPPKPKATAPAAAPAKLVIEPAKIDLVRSGLTEVTIDRDGTVAVAGKPLIKLTSDGKVTKPDGTLLASLADDGTVVIAGAPPSERVIQIDDNGLVQVDGEDMLRIDEDGSVWKRGADGKLDNDGLAVFEGSAASRRAIARLLVSMTMGATAAPPPPPRTRQ